MAKDAKYPIVSLTRRARNDLHQRHTRRGGRARDLTSDNLHVPPMFDTLLGDSQLVPQETTGSALRGSSHSTAVDGEKVLLPPDVLCTKNLY